MQTSYNFYIPAMAYNENVINKCVAMMVLGVINCLEEIFMVRSTFR